MPSSLFVQKIEYFPYYVAPGVCLLSTSTQARTFLLCYQLLIFVEGLQWLGDSRKRKGFSWSRF